MRTYDAELATAVKTHINYFCVIIRGVKMRTIPIAFVHRCYRCQRGIGFVLPV